MNGLAVVIPFFNGSRDVQETYDNIVKQTVKPDYMIAVDDCSTDDTFSRLTNLERKGVELVVLKTPVNSFRCGAINAGLRCLRDETDVVVLMDAGTELAPDAFENAVRTLESDGNIGIVCSIAGVKTGRGLLHRLQKLEYAGFDAFRLSNKDDVLISHGLFSAARVSVLRSVGFYSPRVLLEDYDLTVKIKMKGYKAVFRRDIKAFTNTVPSLRKLCRQRYRWCLGGLDVISKFGWNKATRGDIINHGLFFTLFGAVISSAVMGGHFQSSALSVVPISFAVFGWISNMYGLKLVQNRDWKDVVLRASLFPELGYAVLLSCIQIFAYVSKVFVHKRIW